MFRPTNLMMSVALLFGGASMLTAQALQAAPRKRMNHTEDFRRQAPAPLASKALNIPTPFETRLANGLQLVIVESKRLPLVSYRLAFRAGSASDPQELPGLTRIMTGMLTEGTETRTSRQIAEEVARLGATLSAGSNADYTTVAASALSTYSDQILDLMADVALQPSFPENELQLDKQNSIQRLVRQRAQPDFLANERLSRILFGQHPYATISATPESINATTRERLQSFHRSMFIPNNAVLIVTGDIERDAVSKRVGELFGKWNRGQAVEETFPTPPVRSTRALYVVDRPGSAQSNIVIANTAITRTSADYFPMLVMHTIVGAIPSSRLFMNLRESKGYTYSPSSELDTRRTAGSFRASAEVRGPVTGASLKEFFYELERIRNEAVSEKELRDAKAFLTGVFPIRLETQEGLIDQLVQIKMFDLSADYLQTYRERIQAVSAADVQRVARRYVMPDKTAVVIVGDAAAIMDQIEPYSQTIEIYDTAGHRKDAGASVRHGSGQQETPKKSEGAANLVGEWTLEITTPSNQTLPATLTMKQDGDHLSGTVETQIGDGELSNVTLNGNNFNATIKFNNFSRIIDGTVTGSTEGDSMKGTITLKVEGLAPLPFTGTRQKKEEQPEPPKQEQPKQEQPKEQPQQD
ncbi:MAG TPA: pitrilysin family protein [Pyrinomonadaceae bacterium]|jgi:zinc protease